MMRGYTISHVCILACIRIIGVADVVVLTIEICAEWIEAVIAVGRPGDRKVVESQSIFADAVMVAWILEVDSQVDIELLRALETRKAA